MTKPRALPPNLFVGHADSGCLLNNITTFAGVLRRAGFAAGLDRETAAADALARLGVNNKADVFWALAAIFVEKHEQLEIFRQAFYLFWRGQKTMTDDPMSTAVEGKQMAAILEESTTTLSTAVALPEVLRSAGAEEILADKDFAKMNKEEWQDAMRVAQMMRLLVPPIGSRRRVSATRGKPDMRRTIRRALARGGDAINILHTRRGEQQPIVVVLTDISGSMSVYARAFLHFIAGLSADGRFPVRAFLLGTQLSAVPRSRGIGAEEEAARIAACAQDWDGGTKLTPSLRQFNRLWLRRVPNAVILFATDGLERHCDTAALTVQIERLSKSCRRLLWLNPLLRYEQYAPLARGASILAKHAHAQYAIHNIRSLAELLTALGGQK